MRTLIAPLPLAVVMAAILFNAVAEGRTDYGTEVSAYKGWQVRALEIRGLNSRMASNLARGLELSTKPALYPRVLEDDIARAELFLAQRGYPYATVSADFVPSNKRKEVKVLLDIDPGPPVVVKDVEIAGMPEDLSGSARGLMSVSPGSVFSDRKVEATKASLDSLLDYWGYAREKVTTDVEAVDTTTAVIRFHAEPGNINCFRKIDVHSAPDDLAPLTRKVVGIKHGRRYSPKLLRDARDNLRRLDIYRRIDLKVAEVGEDSLDLSVKVAVKDRRTAKASVRYWNDEGLRLGASWRDRNLFRGGRGLNLAGLASMLVQRLEVSLWWPALVAPRTRETVSAVIERQSEDAYTQIGFGLSLASTYFFTVDNNIQTTLLLADVSVDSKGGEAIGEAGQHGLLTQLSMRANQNSTDDPFNPRRGVSSWTEVKWAPNGSVSEYHYITWEGSGSTYLSQVEPVTLALRLGLGAGIPTGTSASVLAGERFYSGGANSMRGFGRRRLGPKDSEGNPVGGEAKLEASVELRGPIYWRIWGTLFADAGQVWLKADDIDLGEIEVAVGPGLWLMTPVGPLRFDVGYRLTLFDASEPRWAYHLSIGPAF
jgi:outer membrane protein insertion porin family